MANDKKTIRKKKAKLNFTKGVAHIHSSFNNGNTTNNHKDHNAHTAT